MSIFSRCYCAAIGGIDDKAAIVVGNRYFNSTFVRTHTHAHWLANWQTTKENHFVCAQFVLISFLFLVSMFIFVSSLVSFRLAFQ